MRIPAGTFTMGSTVAPEEGPPRAMETTEFEIGKFAVTNAEFAAFVAETDYVTIAERALDDGDFPEATAAGVGPGAVVFTPTEGPVDLRFWRQWWRWVEGASWRAPSGPGLTRGDVARHPVVQIAYPDALAYAHWADARLPTEVEWEFAARGGLDRATFAWGEEPNDGTRANTWQGRFPYLNTGVHGTAPVGSYPPNGYGLYEMTGNTWEWTSSEWTERHDAPSGCCGSGGEGAARVIKGGSHLCAPEYCLRYRPAARSSQSQDSATSHLGFRLARSV